MGCSSCGKRQVNARLASQAMSNLAASVNPGVPGLYAGIYPLGANDIEVYLGKEQKAKRFSEQYWNKDEDHLILYFSELNKESILSAKKQLADIDTKVIYAFTQKINIADLKDLDIVCFSSRVLAQRLGLLMRDGKAKPASIFIGKDGRIVKQEHFTDERRLGDFLAEMMEEIKNVRKGS